MMTLNQEVLKRAQDEIDNVVGADRLPTMNDRPNLPYIDCIVKEVFRCVLKTNTHTHLVLANILISAKYQSHFRPR